MAGPLSGIRVLDLSRILAGPWATQCLADLGADVIKVERPGVGDDTRTWGPPFFEDANAEGGQTAAYYMSANRNKRSIAIDITDAEGQAVKQPSTLFAECERRLQERFAAYRQRRLRCFRKKRWGSQRDMS